MPGGVAPAATPVGCSFATPGTGTYASTLCWFDLSAYNATAASKPAGQPMTVSLPGGYTIAFNLHVSGAPVKTTSFPTYPGAFLGNRGFYTGVTGRPALYQTMQGTTTTATLDNIAVTGPGVLLRPGTRSSAPMRRRPTPTSRSRGRQTRRSA